MVFYKKVEIRDQKDRYGGSQKGIFALERIEKGEKIWYCECGNKDGSYTRKQLLDIIKKQPKLDYFIRSFSYMIDDDLYALPYGYLEEKNNDECALFNHSCNPTCGFTDDGFGDNVVAIRSIEPGEELTYHYGILETEASLIYGLVCKCNCSNCCGKLKFDYYRDQDFVDKYFDYMTPYLKQKSIDIKTKWYSSSCYVKRYLPTSNKLKTNKIANKHQLKQIATSTNSTSSTISLTSSSSSSSSSSDDSTDDYSTNDDIEEWDKGLCCLHPIKKGELVARFSTDLKQDQLSESKHFIRNSSSPTCYLINYNVYASTDLNAETELTLDFFKLYNF